MIVRAISDFLSDVMNRFEQPPEIDWEAKAEIDRQRVRRYAIEQLPIDAGRKSVSDKPS
jgi:hypothetical protein